jgi:glycosyltransferase involved in cell wall biosynthesis
MKGIKYISLHEDSGYGDAGKALVRGLANAGVPVCWQPMEPGYAWGLGYQPFTGASTGDASLDRLLHRDIPYDTVIVHTVPEYYPRWIEREPGKRCVAHTVWESDQIPEHWIPLLNRMDMVIVPSRWNAATFRACGVRPPIHTIPHILEPPREAPPEGCPPPREPARAARFRFYHIGAWTDRKAPWLLLESYLQAFTARDPVELIVKTDWSDQTQFQYGRRWRWFGRHIHNTRLAAWRIRRRHRRPARLRLLARHVPARQIAALHRQGDCYAALPYAEGWGLGAFQAAGLGKPVLMPRYGGQADYLPEADAWLVDAAPIPARQLSRFFVPGNWAVPDVQQASRLLRAIFENRAEAAARGARLQQFVRAHFNETRVVGQLLAALEQR